MKKNTAESRVALNGMTPFDLFLILFFLLLSVGLIVRNGFSNTRQEISRKTSVLLMERWWFFSGLFLLLLLLAASSGIPPSTVLLRIRRYAMLIAVAFILPVFFGGGSHVLADIGAVRMTTEGLRQGGLFAFRIFLLLFASTILLRTTSPEEITRGLSRMIRPFECMGLPAKRSVEILSLAWEAIPRVWITTRNAIAEVDFNQARNFKKLIPLLSDLITAVYIRAGSENQNLKGGR